MSELEISMERPHFPPDFRKWLGFRHFTANGADPPSSFPATQALRHGFRRAITPLCNGSQHAQIEPEAGWRWRTASRAWKARTCFTSY